MNHSRFIIAAAASGSGKTTLTMGLLRALRQRGFVVAPFKCGPDYIDTKFHAAAARRTSINLDLFFSSDRHVRELVSSGSLGCDVAVIEGAMGLFDGHDGMKGSCAEIAIATRTPVILVVNAKSLAYSVAPLIYGFKSFDKRVNVAGVIFNNVSTASHQSILELAVRDTGVKVLGFVPSSKDIEVGSRHLGLTILDNSDLELRVSATAALVEKYVDIDSLLDITRVGQEVASTPVTVGRGKLRVAVARDEAFNFIYEQNMRSFESLGTVTSFSPLRDSALPGADLVYFPGGYPELYLPGLSSNESMKQSIKSHHERGGCTLAECGGMMYLSKSIVDKEGTCYPVVGIFDQVATMQDMKLTLGYRSVRFGGKLLRGHEFHYSRVLDSRASCLPAEVTNARGEGVGTSIYRENNSVGSYVHFYWGEIVSLDALFPQLFNH